MGSTQYQSDSDGLGLTLYIDGQRIDQRLAQVQSKAVKAYVTDQLGSVLNTKVAGKAKTFGAWGESVSQNLVISKSSDPVRYGKPESAYRR